MSDGMRRELVYLSSYATNRYFIPNWGKYINAHYTNKDINVHYTNQIHYTPHHTNKNIICPTNN